MLSFSNNKNYMLKVAEKPIPKFIPCRGVYAIRKSTKCKICLRVPKLLHNTVPLHWSFMGQMWNSLYVQKGPKCTKWTKMYITNQTELCERADEQTCAARERPQASPGVFKMQMLQRWGRLRWSAPCWGPGLCVCMCGASSKMCGAGDKGKPTTFCSWAWPCGPRQSQEQAFNTFRTFSTWSLLPVKTPPLTVCLCPLCYLISQRMLSKGAWR